MDALETLEAELTRIEREANANAKRYNGNSVEDSEVRDHVRHFRQACRDIRRMLAQGEDINKCWAHLSATTMRSCMALQTGDPRYLDHRIATIAEVEYTEPPGGENGDSTVEDEWEDSE